MAAPYESRRSQLTKFDEARPSMFSLEAGIGIFVPVAMATGGLCLLIGGLMNSALTTSSAERSPCSTPRSC